MLHWNRNFVSIADFYCGEDVRPVSADVIRLKAWPEQAPGLVLRRTHTVVVDLTPCADQMLARMKKRNRNRIRRAREKDRLRYEHYEGEAVLAHLDEFLRLCNQFTHWKGHYHSDGEWMHELAGHGLLSLSFTRLPENGGLLSWESHLVSAGQVVCLSAGTVDRRRLDSLDNALVGRATRYHVWQDMLRFKGKGIAVFDFGGCHPDAADRRQIEIDEFKLSFGGRVREQFEIARAGSLKGRLAVMLKSRLSEHFP